MRSIVLSMDELSDSREVMESKEPASIRWFILILSVAILLAIAMASCFDVDEYVKTSGEVKTSDNASNVTMTAGAKVNDVCVQEGDTVKKGDNLFILDVEYARQKLDIVEKQLAVLTTKCDNLVLLRESVESGENKFVGERYNEEFSSRYEQFRSGRELSEQEYESSQQKKDLTEKDNQNKLSAARESLNEKESLLAAYNYLRDCIEDNDPYDGSNSLVSAAYDEYASNLQKAELSCDNALKTYNDLSEKFEEQRNQELVSSEDVEKTKQEAEAVFSSISKMTSDFLAKIDVQIALLTLQQENDMVMEDQNGEGSLSEADAGSVVESNSTDELLQDLQMLKNAVISGDEYFCTTADARALYESYIESVSEQQREYESLLIEYNDLLNKLEKQEASHVTQTDLDNAKYAYENSAIEIERIRSAFRSQIESSISSTQSEIKTLESSIQSLSTALSDHDNDDSQYTLTTEKNKNDYVVSINSEIDSVNAEIASCQSQIADLQDAVDNGIITASCDGTVTLLYDINNGDIIQAGTQLCTIVPSSDSLKAVLLIPESDISKVSIGQSVEYIINAIPYNEYGRVTGTIISITADSTTIQGQNSRYYLAQSEIPVHVLKNNAGEERSIQTGMLLEGKIICGSKKALVWLLQKINLMD